MDLPRYVQIEPVGECNLRCQMCPIQFCRDGSATGKPAFMEWDLFEHILDGFPELEHLHLQGLGEPMMHPRFFDMITAATERGVRVTTNSNLTLLSSRRAGLCLDSGLDCIHVSIDGATADTYERIRVNARFDRVVGNLQLLQTVKRAHGSPLPHIRLVMVLMQQNLPELPDLVHAAADWGVTSMFVQHLCHDFGEEGLPSHYRPMREFVEQQTLVGGNDAQIAAVFERAQSAADENGIELRLPRTVPHVHPAGTPGPSRCDWPWRGAYFSYDGYSMPCCMISTPDRLHFGSVRHQAPGEVWNNAAHTAFRSQLASDAPPSVCQSCSLYTGVF